MGRSSVLSLSSRSLQRQLALHEQTYQALRTAILSGELVPGVRLVETQLAEKLQVSRTPIREALRQLQRDGLAISDVRGGLYVTTISITDAGHLYDCRIALEQQSVVDACQKGSEAQIKKLEQIMVKAEKILKGKPSQLLNYQLLDADYQFHREIAEISENPWLQSLLDQVFDKMMLLRLQTTRHNPEVLEIRTEHQLIYEAIARRDSVAATMAIRTHLSASKQRVILELNLLQHEFENSDTNLQIDA
jgi:DNA-binding GntR family transcriptional regulator